MGNVIDFVLVKADTFGQVDGANLYPLIKPEYREALQKLNEQAQENGICGMLEYVLTGLKGKELWLETSGRSVALDAVRGVGAQDAAKE